MKQKTKKELEQLTCCELVDYLNKRNAYNDKLEFTVLGFCLGGTICTVLMCAIYVW